MIYFPANYIQAGGANDDPSPLSLDSWAKTCSQYVDPTSAIGERLVKDTMTLAADMGFYDSAHCVTGSTVKLATVSRIELHVTFLGMQNDWGSATEYGQDYTVRFNSDGKITDVIEQ